MTKVEQLIKGDRFRILGLTYTVTEVKVTGDAVALHVDGRNGTGKVIPFTVGDKLRILV